MENASGHHEEGLHEIGRLGPLCQLWIDKMNKWHDNYSSSSYYDFINILSMLVSINITNINIHVTYVKKSVVYCCFWKLCFIDRNAYFKPQFNFFFWNFRVFYFSYHFSIDVDIIETYVYPLYIIFDRNQEFIFLHCKHFVFMKD